MTAGLSGGGSIDVLKALNPGGSPDFARTAQLWEPLVKFGPDVSLQLCLAEEVTPNSDATSWTIRLRPGVTFHNGKPLTADDVIYTFGQVADPKNVAFGATAIVSVDVANLKKIDPLTVQVPCKTPFSTLKETLACYYYNIIPEGSGFLTRIGTGPFVYDSFTPGVQSVFKRNENYWQHGLPYLDSLVISDFSDETSQVNGLLSGAVDVVDLLSSASISTLSSRAQLLISNAYGYNPIYFRVDLAPFKDPRVREAFKLIPNRRQMLDLVFDGHGTIGNDVFGYGDPEYDSGLPQREQDIDQAKFLLKQAGHENLTVTLNTANLAQGVVSTAQVFAQQASQAGVTVQIKEIPTSQLYGPDFLKWPLAQDLFYYQPYLFLVALCTIPTSPDNETHFNDPNYTSLYQQALRTTDISAQTEIAHQLQQIDYSMGGSIIPYFPPNIDAAGSHVHGLVKGKCGLPLNNFDLTGVWLD